MLATDPPGQVDDDFDGKEDDLNPTDDGEPSEQAHSPPNSGQLGFHVRLFILGDQIKGGGVKDYLHKVKLCLYLQV